MRDSAVPQALSLVIPAYDEEASILDAVHEALAALEGLVSRYEVLVVDDGSRDSTAERVEREFGCLDSVRLLRHARNIGYGAALRTGFSAARFEFVAFTDADRQFHLDDLGALLAALEGHAVVCGYRLNRQDHWLRLMYSKIYNYLVRDLLGLSVRDCDCALKIFRRSELRGLQLRSKGFLINAEVLARLKRRGASSVEVGVRHRPRLAGESTVTFLDALPVLAELLAFWWSDQLFPDPAGGYELSAAGLKSKLAVHENSMSSPNTGASLQIS